MTKMQAAYLPDSLIVKRHQASFSSSNLVTLVDVERIFWRAGRVGDWERIFGVGVSAESVFSGIDDSYYRDRRESERLAREKRKALLAFRGERSTKAEFLRRLRLAKSNGTLISKATLGLKSVAFDNVKTFSELEEKYRIPESLACTIQYIFEGITTLSYGHHYYKDATKWQKAVDWLFECAKSIKVGTDLRFIAPQFAACISSEALSLIRGCGSIADGGRNLNSICDPAMAVIYCRARGVFLPNDFIEGAFCPLKKCLDIVPTEGASPTGWGYYYEQKVDAALAAIDAAGDISCDGVARALDCAIMAPLRDYGEVSHSELLRKYSIDFVSLIFDAPVLRIRAIDLNKFYR